MRLLIEWLWNYIRVLLYGKLFKKKGVKKVKLYNKPSNTPSSSKEVYLTYRNTNASVPPHKTSVPKHKTRIKNRHNRKRRHKNESLMLSGGKGHIEICCPFILLLLFGFNII